MKRVDNKGRRSARLGFEALEERRLLAGNVLLVSSPDQFESLADDSALVDFLTDHGFTIDPDSGAFEDAPPSAAQLADVDAIVFSRATLSGAYNDGNEENQWNALDVPMLVLNPLLAASNRWGFVDTTDRVLNDPAPTQIDALPDPGHPLVQEVTTGFFEPGRTISFNPGASVPTNSVVVATLTTQSGVGSAIIDVPTGATMLGGAGVAGERRILFAVDDYTDTPGGGFSLAPAGEQALLRALNTLTGDLHVLQAEHALLSGVRAVGPGDSGVNPGFYVDGYADYRNSSNDFIQWEADARSGGDHRLTFRYTLGSSSPRPLRLTVNGSVVDPSLDFPLTNSWSTWEELSLEVPLVEGNNTIRLTAIGSSGGNFDQLSVLRVAPPVAPTNLVASGISSSGVVLSWIDNATDEATFSIERRALGGVFAELATVPANSTGYNDTGLTASTSYEYRVRALNSAGESEFSNTVQATTLPPGAELPSITAVNPTPGGVGISLDRDIVASVFVPNGGIDASSITPETVKLYPSGSPSSPVELVVNTSGGGDIIVARPTSNLLPNTSYTFEVTGGLKDFIGVGFAPYLSSFTTGDQVGATDETISFEHLTLESVPTNQYTGLTIGPDGKLYASTVIGDIVRWTILSDGTLGPAETITSLRDAAGENRLLIGIEFAPASTAENLILWATHTEFGFSGIPDFGGRLTQLSGGNLENVQDFVVNLPRSVRDHVTNQMDFGPDGAIYFLQGSNSAMGAPDNAWSNRPERLLSAAVLRFDPALWDASVLGPLDAHTEDADPYDPFATDAPLTIYASGIRNAYDLVWHSNGWLYVPTNGSASGGNSPATPAIPAEGLTPRIDEDTNGPYTGPSVPALNGIGSQHDYLFRIEENGYYGHPNPTRNEFVLNGGNPTSGVDPAEVDEYPEGVLPDRNYRGFAYDFGTNRSPNGVIEYQYGGFGGALVGKLLVARFSSGDDLILLEPGADGDIISSNDSIASFNGFADPLDLIEDPTTGNLYVSEYSQSTGQGGIRLLRPQEPEIDLSAESLVFNDVPGGGASAVQSVVVTNSGTFDLTIPAGGISLAGSDTDQFDLTGALVNEVVLAPGEELAIGLAFNPNATGVFRAQLLVQSSDPDDPLLTVSLGGLGHSQFQGGGEPPLAQILELLNIPVDVGFSGLTTPYSTELLGEEIVMPLLAKAGPGDVVIEPLATFGPSATPDYRIGWYEPGGAPTLHQIAELESLDPVSGGDGQTVNPVVVDGTLSFDPGNQPFGLYGDFPSFTDRQAFSEDALNTFDQGRRKFRFWPLKDSAGNIVPDAFVVGVEEATNNDLNDVVFIVRNVRPPVELPGDYNHDGTVDSIDYAVWREHLGTSATPYQGADGSGNGLIDQADYQVWLDNYGSSLPQATVAVQESPTPEVSEVPASDVADNTTPKTGGSPLADAPAERRDADDEAERPRPAQRRAVHHADPPRRERSLRPRDFVPRRIIASGDHARESLLALRDKRIHTASPQQPFHESANWTEEALDRDQAFSEWQDHWVTPWKHVDA